MSKRKRSRDDNARRPADVNASAWAVGARLGWILLAACLLFSLVGWRLIRGFGHRETRGRINVAPTTVQEATRTAPDAADVIEAPGLARRRYVAPLEDAFRRLDPTEDGWHSEAFSNAAEAQLKHLAKLLEQPADFDAEQLRALASDHFACRPLRPASLREVFRDSSTRVRRGANSPDGGEPDQSSTLHGWQGLGAAAGQLVGLFDDHGAHVTLKQFKVHMQQESVSTKVFFQAVGGAGDETLQINATWRLQWTTARGQPPGLDGIEVEAYEEIRYHGPHTVMFADCTESVLGDTDCYRAQFLYATDHWRARIPRELGLDVVANHGLAIGDVNGDQLDDLYVCQQGGLPNRLLIQNSDGTLRDATAQSGADWLDYCASALLVDLDNDGDRDLVVAQEWRILLMSNDGHGRFQLEFGIGSKAQSFSMTAADYDQDGDLDLYVCGYNPTVSTLRRGAMGEPMPYHDANNGGQNTLLRNEGNWQFVDATAETGLDRNNTRFSFAASWEDYDNDGDLDLYVANDYGRNNLFRNDGGRFVDVAPQLGVEDMSAGMSASWADYNRDGWMDLYVSNMFSAAGNRITFQRQFKSGADPTVRAQFQRMARGNTLFENTGDGRFRDVSEQAGVTMGRWAWGSKFVDLNSDGWEDLVVVNGFITSLDTGDL